MSNHDTFYLFITEPLASIKTSFLLNENFYRNEFHFRIQKKFTNVKRALCDHGWIYATHTDLYDEIK